MDHIIKTLSEKGQIKMDKSFKNLADRFMEKARDNLITMNILLELNDHPKVRKLLNISEKYDSSEWAVISGYYAMYSSALALIAKKGFKSKTHNATIILLEKFYLNKNELNKEDLFLISEASFRKEELEQISDAKHKREITQYSVTKQTTKNIAEKIKNDAYAFVNKAQEILLNNQ